MFSKLYSFYLNQREILLNKTIERLQKSASDTATEKIGRIGQKNITCALKTIPALKEIGSNQATEEIERIVYKYGSADHNAILALTEIASDKAARVIGNIGYKHERVAHDAILALKEIASDSTARMIGNIGCEHERVAHDAILALKEFGTDQAVEVITDIGQQYPEYAPLAMKTIISFKPSNEQNLDGLTTNFISAVSNKNFIERSFALIRPESTPRQTIPTYKSVLLDPFHTAHDNGQITGDSYSAVQKRVEKALKSMRKSLFAKSELVAS